MRSPAAFVLFTALLTGCASAPAPHAVRCEGLREWHQTTERTLEGRVGQLGFVSSWDETPHRELWPAIGARAEDATRLELTLEASEGFALVFEPLAVCPRDSQPCPSFALDELDRLPEGGTFGGGAQLVARVGDEGRTLVLDAPREPGRLLVVRTARELATPLRLRAEATLTFVAAPTFDCAAPADSGRLVAPTLALWPRQPRCGDGLLAAERAEACDDGNRTDGDGCTAACTLEGPRCTDAANLWQSTSCSGEPSRCEAITCTPASEDEVCVVAHRSVRVSSALRGRLEAGEHVALQLAGTTLDCPVWPGVLARDAGGCAAVLPPCSQPVLGPETTHSLALVDWHEAAPDAAEASARLESARSGVRWSGLVGNTGSLRALSSGDLVGLRYVRASGTEPARRELVRLALEPGGIAREVWALTLGGEVGVVPIELVVGLDDRSHVLQARYGKAEADGHYGLLGAELLTVDASGAPLWTASLPASVAGLAVARDGTRLAVSTIPVDDVAGALVLLDASDGRTLAEHVRDDLRFVLRPAFAPDGTLLVLALANGPDPAPVRLERLEPDTGEWLSRSEVAVSVGAMQLAGVAPDGGALLLERSTGASASQVHAIAPDGSLTWSRALVDDPRCTRGGVTAALDPADGDLLVALSGLCAGINGPYAVTVERLGADAQARWLEGLGPFEPPPAPAAGTYDALAAHGIVVGPQGEVLVYGTAGGNVLEGLLEVPQDGWSHGWAMVLEP